MDCPTSFNVIKIISYKHAQRHIFQVVLDSVKLTRLTITNVTSVCIVTYCLETNMHVEKLHQKFCHHHRDLLLDRFYFFFQTIYFCCVFPPLNSSQIFPTYSVYAISSSSAEWQVYWYIQLHYSYICKVHNHLFFKKKLFFSREAFLPCRLNIKTPKCLLNITCQRDSWVNITLQYESVQFPTQARGQLGCSFPVLYLWTLHIF